MAIYYQDNANVKNTALALQKILSNVGVNSNIIPVSNLQPPPIGGFLLNIDSNLQIRKEGYQLSIVTNSAKITGVDAAGLFYGVQTIGQLIMQKQKIRSLPNCTITDWPAYSIRGFMHDTGRNFREISALKVQLDRFSSYKYNTFHLHLTDNPAWRPESKLFPQLNDPGFRKAGRDEGRSYSFDEIREIIKYAAERHIRIIPELDMPGHSEYFETTFGFKMETEQGMTVLEKLLDEFCSEIPAKDCPVIHIGSDEVHIPNPDQFIDRMCARLKANGRKAMVWSPGLKANNEVIKQLWNDITPSKLEKITHPFIDSYAGYLNSMLPMH
ncbi:family 20 glycosylhydrolase [Niabella hibiscisoli]|uniref:family 20 glycosylhydrolase n=1 Tax=Niabella hibiscisoli TaxID=1825928 RepID=UPI001F0EC854|nr:family 20 glycosylhydrolase [Niabella hibiscisoli]MCH5719272.1 beta-N-acetylhexosaminidase [Niabella hibiscisoli]